MFSNSLGIVDRDSILEALQKVRRGEEVPMITLRRTLCLEGWLKDLRGCGDHKPTYKLQAQAGAATLCSSLYPRTAKS